MEEEIKSVQSTTQKQQVFANLRQSKFSSNENAIYSGMDKTYDDFNPQKSLLSVLFKFVPITLYLILKLVTDQQLSIFIIISIMVAMDFWTTKNILGPKLVGLKWFSIEDENQNQKWCFASCTQTRIISKVNSLFFWIPQLLAISFWIVIIFLNAITLGLFWAALAIYAAFLLVLNFAFFLQCKGDHQNKVNLITKKLGFEVYKKDEVASQSGSFAA